MLDTLKSRPYESLTVEERIILTTSVKLIKHFKAMESAGIVNKEATANFIGSVKKLAAVACGVTQPAQNNEPRL